MIILQESFESPVLTIGALGGTPVNWTKINGTVFLVESQNPNYFFGNHDGVIGNQFVALGNNLNRGNIYYTLTTTPGVEYAVSYNFSFSDSFRFESSPSVTTSFDAYALAYHGLKTIIDHQGNPMTYEDLRSLDSVTHSANLPGLRDYELGPWNTNSYSFVATSDVTRIGFKYRSTTSLFNSTGVIDNVVVRIIPEPQAAGLLSIVLLAILVRRHRQSSPTRSPQ